MTDPSSNKKETPAGSPHAHHPHHHHNSSNNNNHHESTRGVLRRTAKASFNTKNTRAEFKRLKTILPSIKKKDNVSKLDIILEAIKYIDDLQDQLIDRLTGTHSQREATLLALTEQDMQRSRERLSELRSQPQIATSSDDEALGEDLETDEDDELINDEAVIPTSTEDHNSSIHSDEDANSHASLEL